MPYYLHTYDKNYREGLELNEKEASPLITLKKFLDNYSSIEQKYDIVINNFIDFELKLIQFTFNHELRSDLSKLSENIKTSGIHSSFVNLVLSLGIFIEQFSKRHLEIVANNIKDLSDIKDRFVILKKENPEINFLTALRDYTAHRDIPLNLITINGKWESNDDEIKNRLGHCTIPKIIASKLESDRKFKKTSLNNIDIDIKGNIDLRKPTRIAIRILSEILEEIRNQSESTIHTCRTSFNRYIKMNSEHSSNKINFCYLFEEFNSDNVKKYFIDLNQIDILDFYKARNPKLISLEKRFFHNSL